MVISTAEIQKINQITYCQNPNNYYITESSVLSIVFNNQKNDFSESILNRLIADKFVIVRTNPSLFSQQDLFNLDHYFGKVIIQHYGHTENGLFKIEKTDFGKTTAKSNKAQPLHTDHSFGYGFTDIVVLYCDTSSKEGGYTKLVKASDVYNFIKCTNPDLLEDTKLQYITRHGGYSAESISTLKNGNLALYWSPFTQEVKGNSKSEEVYRLINWYSQQPENQITYKLKPGELIIIDNMAMLHARSEFPETDKRTLYRMWYDGKTRYDLNIGFKE
jgi:alpha-ketoglutarate-dependent taurine dioxygenase